MFLYKFNNSVTFSLSRSSFTRGADIIHTKEKRQLPAGIQQRINICEHEEIDEKWDIVQSVMDTYGVDVAYITAQQLQVIAGSANLLELYGPETLRKRMHNSLDGKTGGMERFTPH